MYNSREVLLGLPTTDYSAVKKMVDQFDPFLQFWTTAQTFRVGALLFIDPFSSFKYTMAAYSVHRAVGPVHVSCQIQNYKNFMIPSKPC